MFHFRLSPHHFVLHRLMYRSLFGDFRQRALSGLPCWQIGRGVPTLLLKRAMQGRDASVVCNTILKLHSARDRVYSRDGICAVSSEHGHAGEMWNIGVFTDDRRDHESEVW